MTDTAMCELAEHAADCDTRYSFNFGCRKGGYPQVGMTLLGVCMGLSHHSYSDTPSHPLGWVVGSKDGGGVGGGFRPCHWSRARGGRAQAGRQGTGCLLDNQ